MNDEPLTPEDKRLVRRSARLHLYHTLASHPDERTSRVLPSTISDYVDGTCPDTDGSVRRLLWTDLALRRLYMHLRERRTVAKEAVRIAAASRGESKLVLDQGTIYWQRMDDGSRHTLVLQLAPDVPTQPLMRPVLHLEWDGNVDRVVFPEIIDGTAQFVLASDDPRMVRLIADSRLVQPETLYRIVLG